MASAPTIAITTGPRSLGGAGAAAPGEGAAAASSMRARRASASAPSPRAPRRRCRRRSSWTRSQSGAPRGGPLGGEEAPDALVAVAGDSTLTLTMYPTSRRCPMALRQGEASQRCSSGWPSSFLAVSAGSMTCTPAAHEPQNEPVLQLQPERRWRRPPRAGTRGWRPGPGRRPRLAGPGGQAERGGRQIAHVASILLRRPRARAGGASTAIPCQGS